ncbi:FadR/GntR family transcriptional regulator [uncultured Devosia sp.]|uniref:FadR/GntR family transcriptional regulator n=1 Tax=uncultured Devosia sp. TaxID=211434 RepID=UPI0035CA382F
MAKRTAQTADTSPDLAAMSLLDDGASDFGGGMLERRSLAEQVANRVMAMIKSGNLKSGDKLPTEAQMGIAFGISRPPLREALKALTLMGVLVSRQGGRYSVTDLSPSRLVAPFNTMLSVADYDVHQQFEARTVVDLELVRLCALRASRELRQRIHTLAVDGIGFDHDPVAFRLLDIEFHQAINGGAANDLLSALAQVLYDLGLDVRRTASEMPGVIARSVNQHIAVADALVAGDAEAAVLAYRRHLEHVRDTTIQSMAAGKPQ